MTLEYDGGAVDAGTMDVRVLDHLSGYLQLDLFAGSGDEIA